MDNDYLFPDSPPNSKSRRRGNIMDELLAKSEVAQYEDTPMSKPTFVLDKQYTSNLPSNHAAGDSFMSKLFDSKDDSNATKTQPERRGRRGISPTINKQTNPIESNSSLDWLESKEESNVVNNDRAKFTPKSAESSVEIQKSNKVESQSSQPSYLDWLGPKSSQKLDITGGTNLPIKTEVSPSKIEPVTVEKSVIQSATKPLPTTSSHLVLTEDAHFSDATIFDLQSRLKRLEFECKHLTAELESSQTRHQQELDAIETSFKRRSQLLEDSYQRREKQLQEEINMLMTKSDEWQKLWDKERNDLISNWQRRLDEATQERVQDLERMKQLHHQMFVSLKQDHDTAISRLQQIKKVEIEALNDAQSHSKTLHSVIEQLKSNTMELCDLQTKVESGLNGSVKEREIVMNSKDEQLKYMKEQIEKERGEGEQRQIKMRQTIVQLEEKLHKQSMQAEEEQWKLRQEKAKLEVDKKYWEESRKMSSEQIENERQQLQKLKNSLMEEQKQVLESIYSPPTVQRLKAQTELDSNANWLREEKQRLEKMRNEIESEERVLQMRKVALEQEKESVDSLVLQLKQRSEEVEEMCISASQSREEGFNAARVALNLENELKKRQDLMWRRLEDLKYREQHLAEERLEIVKERKELEYLRQRLLCVRCQLRMDDDDSKSARLQMSGEQLASWQRSSQLDQQFLQRESLFLNQLETLPLYLPS